MSFSGKQGFETRTCQRRPVCMPEPPKKILCIEDDRETAALIAEELIDRGYDVTVAHDGREGLTAILKTMPDLVLSDISMPVMSGFELLERLIALAPRFSKMPFVFLTALNDREVEVLTWVARGKTSMEIAQILGLTKRTIDFHIDNARTKLDAATRTEAVIKAATGRLIEP